MTELQPFFDSLKQFASEATTLIYVLAMAVGLTLALKALLDLVAKGKGSGYGQDKSLGAIVFRLVIASCLVTLASKLDMILSTNGDMTGARQALAYAQGSTQGANGPLSFVWAAISMWCVFMGTAGFMRGFLLLDKASQGGQDSGDTTWRGIWHVIGGALTINLFS